MRTFSCCCLSKWGLEDIISVLMWERQRGITHIQRRRRGCEDRQRLNFAATNQRMPKNDGSHYCRRRQWRILLQNQWKEHHPADTLILDFCPPELRETIYFLKPPSCGHLWSYTKFTDSWWLEWADAPWSCAAWYCSPELEAQVTQLSKKSNTVLFTTQFHMLHNRCSFLYPSKTCFSNSTNIIFLRFIHFATWSSSSFQHFRGPVGLYPLSRWWTLKLSAFIMINSTTINVVFAYNRKLTAAFSLRIGPSWLQSVCVFSLHSVEPYCFSKG